MTPRLPKKILDGNRKFGIVEEYSASEDEEFLVHEEDCGEEMETVNDGTEMNIDNNLVQTEEVPKKNVETTVR